MAHRNLQVEAGQGGNKGGGSIAVNQHHIGPHLFQHFLDPVEDVGSDVKQGLLVLHDGQVIVRHHMERLQHLIQHLPMLAGDADDGFDVFSGL